MDDYLSDNKVIAKQIYKKEMVYLIKVKLVKNRVLLPKLDGGTSRYKVWSSLELFICYYVSVEK